ncbi:MAG: hypothetical protein QNJ51_21855 [Calothrix sp. MO_167.B12]|nr:hypothetical protein [Calothrix sp. MO_167.B12]
MSLNFPAIGGLFIFMAATVGFPSVALADREKKTYNYQTPNEVFERAFFKNDPNFYDNNSFKRELDWMFGVGLFQNSFPENEIARDAELVNIVYRDVLQQQVGNDPYIRTRDLPNPYSSSVMMSPRVNSEKLQVGTEFRFDNSPTP